MNGLQEQFSDEITVISLNASDNGVGQVAYEQLILPGHPAIVIFDANQQEVYRGFGTFEQSELEAQLSDLIAP